MLKIVHELMAKVRKQFPEITDDMLCDDGSIFYFNGNDGTQFDWEWNDHLCEFFIFHKESEKGFIKMYINKDGSVESYVYLDQGKAEAIHIPVTEISPAKVRQMKNYLVKNYDNQGRYDSIIE